MQDSYKGSESSSLLQDEEMTKDAGIYQPQKPAAAEAPSKSGEANSPDEPDYEGLFMRDAIRRAQDEELAALASLAMIRSGSDERGQIPMDPGAGRMPNSNMPKETLEQIISEADR